MSKQSKGTENCSIIVLILLEEKEKSHMANESTLQLLKRTKIKGYERPKHNKGEWLTASGSHQKLCKCLKPFLNRNELNCKLHF